MSRIFINYRRQDSEGYVGRLYDHLITHFSPEDIFMDVQNIDPGADFVQVLEDAVSSCDIFIAVIGPQWIQLTDETGARRIDQWNDFVRIEIASALKAGKTIIPVLFGRAKMPAPELMPEDIRALARRNALEISHQRFAQDVDSLVKFIKTNLPAHPTFKKRPDATALREKEQALKQIRQDLLGANNSPLYAYRIEKGHYPVLGEGYADANILFIGESPGKTEAEIGKPFVGPSGNVLDEMLHTIGLQRENVYLTNILLDHVPDKRDPNPEELAFYTPFLDRIIAVIQPAVIVTLGRFAMEYILKKYDLPEKRGKISQLHGTLFQTQSQSGAVLHIVPLYHPAVVLYSMTMKETLRQDFETLKVFV